MNMVGKINDKSELRRFTIEHYSDKWGRYNLDEVRKRIEIVTTILEPIKNTIKLPLKGYILDIGTGIGAVPFALMDMLKIENGIKIIGIDPSAPIINLATRMALGFKNENFIKFEQGTFEDIAFPDETFDIVISNASFNLSLEKEKAVSEMSRVVKNNGKVIVADCFKRPGMRFERCNNMDQENRLWAVCILGAVERDWLIDRNRYYGLYLEESDDLTNVVKDLVNKEVEKGKWGWREFIDFDLEYHVLVFTKRR